jgi:hypothetical protein
LFQINNSLLAENTARTQNEQQLYSTWQQSEIDKKQMQTTIHNLNELKVMRLEMEKLKLNQKPSEITSQEINDDGDLADDMKCVQNSREKRKFAEVKSQKQSTENKDKASSTASHAQNSQINRCPL